MNKLLRNIIDYYISEIMEQEEVNKDMAIAILEDALQDEDVENTILDFANINKESYINRYK